MQFKVPQNVQREDRIVGPLTLRQLIICGAGGGLAYTVYVGLAKTYLWITWLPPVAIIVIITLLFAFVRPLDLTFAKFLLTWLEFILLPQKRSWTQASAEVIPTFTKTKQKTKEQLKAEEKAQQVDEKIKKIQALSKFLDSRGRHLEQ